MCGEMTPSITRARSTRTRSCWMAVNPRDKRRQQGRLFCHFERMIAGSSRTGVKVAFFNRRPGAAAFGLSHPAIAEAPPPPETGQRRVDTMVLACPAA
jgi:hypothetical protein